MTRTVETPAALADLAKELLVEVALTEHTGATVLALHGDLGVGKTTFVQQLAAVLGVTEMVTSPTFVVMRSYELPEVGGGETAQPFRRLVHVDAYRIESVAEMEVLHFRDTLANPENIICIEWAENIKSMLPENLYELTFTNVDEHTREVTIHGR